MTKLQAKKKRIKYFPPAYKAKIKPLILKNQKEQRTKFPIQNKVKREKVPLNKKSRKQTPERKTIIWDKIPQKPSSPPRIKNIQDVPANIVDSRDHIWMKNDHIILFCRY